MLTQRRLFTTLRFELAADGVDVTERGLTFSRSYRVPFAHIPAHPLRVSTSSGGWLLAAVLFGIVTVWTAVLAVRGTDAEGVVWVVWGFLAAVAGTMFVRSRRKFVIFRSGDPALALLDGQPTQEALDSFLAEMHRRRVAWLGEEALLTSGADVPENLGERLRWLQAAGLLSAAECEELLNGLAHRGVIKALQPPRPQ